MKDLLKSGLAVLLFVVMLGFVGCGGVSEEQMAELNALRAEVNSLEQEVEALQAERTRLERQIAERNVKLKDCENAKAETRANLQKMGK